MSEGFKACGQFALKAFRDKAEGNMTGCCQELGHGGNHVYAVIGPRTLWYMEEIQRNKLKPITHADLKPGSAITEEEAQVLFQYLELVRKRT